MGLEAIAQLLQTEIEILVPKAVENLLKPVLLLRDQPDVLTVSELASIIRETDETKIYDYCQRNEIPHFHFGRNLRFAKPQIINI